MWSHEPFWPRGCKVGLVEGLVEEIFLPVKGKEQGEPAAPTVSSCVRT